MNYSVLLVEADSHLSTYLKELLIAEGYLVSTVKRGSEVLQSIEVQEPDLVIIDTEDLDVHFKSILKNIEQTFPHIKIICLVDKKDENDLVEMLEIGADDYMVKPLHDDLFITIVKKRIVDEDGVQEILRVGDLKLDRETKKVHRGKQEIQLTPKEFELLEYMMINHGVVLTREKILGAVWMQSPDIETRVVDVYMSYLRKKIDDEYDKKLLNTSRGFGYILEEVAET